MPIRRRAAALSLLLALSSRALAAQGASRPVDWNALRDETVRVLADYLKVDNSNPPGNELAGALYLRGILEREGIEVQILDTAELGAGRANFYARLPGSGGGKGIALVHHIDVVTATAKDWSIEPFSGTIKDVRLAQRGPRAAAPGGRGAPGGRAAGRGGRPAGLIEQSGLS